MTNYALNSAKTVARLHVSSDNALTTLNKGDFRTNMAHQFYGATFRTKNQKIKNNSFKIMTLLFNGVAIKERFEPSTSQAATVFHSASTK